jgi:sugar phosphate isomerase/epimerase
MSSSVQLCVAVSDEILGESAPVPFQGGLTDAFTRAAAFGFDAVEIHIRNPDSIDTVELAAGAERVGISIAAIGTGLEHTLNGYNLSSPDDALRKKSAQRFRRHIDLGARFGATVFVGLCRGAAPDSISIDEYLDRFGVELAPLASYADQMGATLSLEPIAGYMTNLLTTTRDTLAFLERPGLESVLLLMDTHHMFFEDGDLEQTFMLCKNRIGHLHISDSDRKYPGSGEIDYGIVGNSLKEIGYDRTVSLEILPSPDGDTAARLGLEWMQGVWR